MKKENIDDEIEVRWKVKECRCSFPFYCGHKKIIISNMDYKYLLMALKYSDLNTNRLEKK